MNETARRKAWVTDMLRIHPEWTPAERERAFFLMPARGTYQMEVYIAYVMNPASPPFPRNTRWHNGELNFDDPAERPTRPEASVNCAALQYETVQQAAARAVADFNAGFALIDNPYGFCSKNLNVNVYTAWGRTFRALLKQKERALDDDIPF